jgi:hypothetical protein
MFRAARHSLRSQFGSTAVSQLIDLDAHEQPFALTAVGATSHAAPRVRQGAFLASGLIKAPLRGALWHKVSN